MKKTLQEYKEIVAQKDIELDFEWCINNLSSNRIIKLTDLANKMYYEQSEWISVEDKLPEYGMRVLCYCQEQNSLGLSHFVWNCAYNETNKSFKDAGIDYSVTHWQPLPNPPQK